MKILRFPTILIGSAIIVAVLAGCTTSQQRVAANTLSSTHDVVQGGVEAYYLASAKGLAPTNGIAVVAKAYSKFQSVYVVAVDFAQNNTNALAPANLLIEATDVANAVGQFYQPASTQIKTSLKIP